MVGEIGRGLVVFLGVGRGDTLNDAGYLAGKVANLRIFEDERGKMNLSVLDIEGAVLAVSQFTLYGDCRKGRRPGFSEALPPEEARGLYDHFVEKLKGSGIRVATGCFREHMQVKIINDGPVTFLLDSKKNF
ncbi:MAG: D-tyrosyl-tRNA(Tyr) deacylase [Pelotomaculum thermopropionicum]|uniref:D-aminoacyl-tRNA deacylase n=1 Tax=Pelotomaculum thermopropionicum TaxID=110500 RepID=A0A101HV34_9FIRM|nr:MAG: D-tyrosyl-tRNA(Tyr) deacylase [Pelotomaculum thermopropionicum]